MNQALIQSLPKIELHCHLDGSICLETLEKLAKKENLPIEPLAKAVAPKKCHHLKEYLESFDVILPLLQSTENLAIAAYDLIEQAACDNVCYIEIRLAPLLHQEEGLTIEEIIQAVWRGISEAQEQYHVQVNLLVSALRHHSEEDNIRLIDSINQLNSGAVVGFDFAGDEQEVSNEKIKSCTEHALISGLNVTLHSGECGCAQNVVEAIRIGAVRIGHGVAIKDDASIMKYCREKGTLLELCPSSNIQTRAVQQWQDYPLRRFIENGVKCCINTDNRTVSQTTLTNEYSLLMKHCQLSYDEMKMLNLSAVEGAFVDEKIKFRLIEQIERGYARVIASIEE